MNPKIDAETGMQVVPVIDDAGSVLHPLQGNINREFKPLYDTGVDAYLGGRWEEAKTALAKANDLKGGDKPCQLLTRVMARFDFKAPDTWKGFRELTSKT
jgi:hypothetical protein